MPPLTQRHPQGLFLPRAYVCYRTSEPIIINGNLEKKAWWDAPWTEAFEDHQAPNTPPPERVTRAAMLWDDEHIYFAARLQEENVWGTLVERDSVIYMDNDFEIFLDVDANGANYYEFEINPLNTAWDMFHPKEYHRRSCLESAYDIDGVQHAVQVQGTLNWHHDVDTGWTVEVSWPWKAIAEHRKRPNIPPAPGTVMRVNFSRVQYPHDYSGLTPGKVPGSRCEDWIWNSTNSGDLHLPELWGRVYFSEQLVSSQKDLALEQIAHAPALRPPAATEIQDDMVHIPACTITLGPDPSDPERSPAHTVDVDAFWIDRHPVTIAQFVTFLNEGGRDEYYFEFMENPTECGIVKEADGRYTIAPGRENHPATYISRPAALAYAESVGKALPTEAQWERAARGTTGRTYPWGEEAISPERANYDFRYGTTTEIGSFPLGATPEGIFDLAGNVREWCLDSYDSYPGGRPMLDFTENTEGLDEHQRAVLTRELYSLRGGGWSKQEANMPSAYRDADGGGRHLFSIGFRCVKTE